jgi:hypothetical protein
MVWLAGNAHNGTQQLARIVPITNVTHQGFEDAIAVHEAPEGFSPAYCMLVRHNSICINSQN